MLSMLLALCAVPPFLALTLLLPIRLLRGVLPALLLPLRLLRRIDPAPLLPLVLLGCCLPRWWLRAWLILPTTVGATSPGLPTGMRGILCLLSLLPPTLSLLLRMLLSLQLRMLLRRLGLPDVEVSVSSEALLTNLFITLGWAGVAWVGLPQDSTAGWTEAGCTWRFLGRFFH